MPVAKLSSITDMPNKSNFDASVAVCSLQDASFTSNGKRMTRFTVIDETIDTPVQATLWDAQASFSAGELVYLNAQVNEYPSGSGRLSLNVNRAPKRIVADDDRRSVDLAPWWEANRGSHVKVTRVVTTIGAAVDSGSEHESAVDCLALVAGADNVTVSAKGKPCVDLTLEDATGRANATFYGEEANTISVGSVLRLGRGNAKVNVWGEKRSIKIFRLDTSDDAVDPQNPRGNADVAFWEWFQDERSGEATNLEQRRFTVKEILDKTFPPGEEHFVTLGNVFVKRIDKDRSTTRSGPWKRLMEVTDASAPDEVFEVLLFGRATEAEVEEGDVVDMTTIKISADSMTGKTRGFLKSSIPIQTSDIALAEACATASSKRQKLFAASSGASPTTTPDQDGEKEVNRAIQAKAAAAESEVDLTPDADKAHLLAVGTRVVAKRVSGIVILGMLYLNGAEKKLLVELPEDVFDDLDALSGTPLEVSLSGRIVQRGVVGVSSKKEIKFFPID
tara:strand:- start:1365 stop:2879 length:1515 start_codon:yes stop_codon:yes gene_type:complete